MTNRTLAELMEFNFDEIVYHKLDTELHKGIVVAVVVTNTGSVLYEVMWKDLVRGTHCAAELTNNQYGTVS